MTAAPRLLVFGPGYSGRAVAGAAEAAGWAVALAGRADAPDLGAVTHLLSTVPPGEDGDPVLARFGATIAAAPVLRWIGYLSTTGVYGDRAGAWVDEATPPLPGSDRSRRRLAAEREWEAAGAGRAVDIFRLAGIYGPGRTPFEDLRAGRARRINRPGHVFGRIHRDDIARAVMAAMAQDRAPGVRVLNLSDDDPAEPQAVIAEAARLLGLPVPPLVPFDAAWESMSPMARSFWAENRKVDCRRTKSALGIEWRYPSYRDGLRAILAEGG
ncbi:MAG: SDR family NAD(P)-dependent oxidoreductase [Proteobacteria bacterium]|nr:SDR family NAD(P)-dependent oxidoreductase [Pseudomonadota bacterium]